MPTPIRIAGPGDAATIHRMIVDLAIYEREPDAVELDTETLALQLAAESPPFECLLAEEDDVAVGFALFFHNYSTWRGRRGLYLEDLFVPPEHRGRGIGKDLLQALASIAVQRDCARMEWAVIDWNHAAMRFYEHLGAKPQSDWVTYRLTGDALTALAAG